MRDNRSCQHRGDDDDLEHCRIKTVLHLSQHTARSTPTSDTSIMFVSAFLPAFAAFAFCVSARSITRSFLSSLSAADITSLPNPDVDPFYQAPVNISSYDPGDVVKIRPVLTTLAGKSVKSYQLFYRTTNPQGEAIGTLATVWTPAIPAVPAKILSFQTAEDSTNLACSPSWAWVNTSSPLSPNANGDAGIIIPWALAQGYHVVGYGSSLHERTR